MSKHDKKKVKEKESAKATKIKEQTELKEQTKLKEHKIAKPDSRGKHDKTSEKKFPVGKVLLFVLIPILAVYFGGVFYFLNNFVPNTFFDGKDYSLKKPELIAEAMTEDTNNRTVVLKGIDGEETISLHDKLNYIKTATAPTKGWIDPMTAWTWPRYIFSKNNLSGNVNVTYDKEKLDETIDSLKFMNPEELREPKDAYLGRNGDKYEIVPEDPGNEIIREKIYAVLEDGIDAGVNEIDLVETDCYSKPKVYRDDPSLTEIFEKYKSVNFQKISIDMTGATEVLETPDIVEFYNDKGEISKDKIRDYVLDLAYQYDTYEETRYFVNSYGYEIPVGTGADTYGFLLDVDGTTEELYDLMKSKKTEDIVPVWTSEGWTRLENGSDIGGTYIEVCISDQKLWAYSGGELVLTTDVVTGNYNKNDTPKGVFTILSKETDTHLKGQEKLPNGKIDKWDSFVNFWMALNWSGVGLHNAPWRSEFGGTIYQGGGSHGCINMNYDAAKYLYNNYSYGVPVIIW